jgi:protein TonB
MTSTALLLVAAALSCIGLVALSQLSPASPGSEPGYIRIEWVVQQVKQLQKKLPDYPGEAKEKGIQGPVWLGMRISKEGKVEEVNVLTGDLTLANPVAEEVKHWEFQPTLLNGEPIGVVTELDLKFTSRKGKGRVECTNAKPHRHRYYTPRL